MQFLAHAHTEPHTHASTSLQCPSPELSPNICGAQHAQLKQQNLLKVHHPVSVNRLHSG